MRIETMKPSPIPAPKDHGDMTSWYTDSNGSNMTFDNMIVVQQPSCPEGEWIGITRPDGSLDKIAVCHAGYYSRYLAFDPSYNVKLATTELAIACMVLLFASFIHHKWLSHRISKLEAAQAAPIQMANHPGEMQWP